MRIDSAALETVSHQRVENFVKHLMANSEDMARLIDSALPGRNPYVTRTKFKQGLQSGTWRQDCGLSAANLGLISIGLMEPNYLTITAKMDLSRRLYDTVNDVEFKSNNLTVIVAIELVAELTKMSANDVTKRLFDPLHMPQEYLPVNKDIAKIRKTEVVLFSSVNALVEREKTNEASAITLAAARGKPSTRKSSGSHKNTRSKRRKTASS